MAVQLPGAAPFVFLSYASAERDRAMLVTAALEAAGVPVWIDRQAISGGSSWSAEIVDGIAGCAAFLVLASAPAYASPNVQRELNLAVEENRPLLPLLLDRAAQPREVRYALAGRQWIEVLDRPPGAWLPLVLQALARLGINPSTPATKPNQPPPEAVPLPPAPAMHLPAPLTSFIGRGQELVEVAALLETTRLLTLTGPGGTGKTRLSIAAARRVADRFPDGAWFVDLSGVTDPAGVLPAIAQLLGVRESEGRSVAVSLAAYLRRKRLLLVLDNVEQVITAALALYDLLAEAAGLSLLVTSRIPLRVGGEHEYAVSPLSLPDVSAAGNDVALRDNPAVQLFLDRARALRPDIAQTDASLSAIGAVCARLDGLPLAIELAAARVKLLPPAQLLARLERRLPLLTGGARSLPARQQTLRATIAWSWELLSASEQVLFRRLSVFAGPFTLAAAEAICNADEALDVLDGLAALVDQSLVRQQGQEAEPRFSLLATLQEFALEQLEDAGETASLRSRHGDYYAALAETADAAYWRSGQAQQDLLRRLDPERDNLLGALGWALSEGDAALGLRLGGTLGSWFYLRAPGEGLRWLERLLGLPSAQVAPSGPHGEALRDAGACALALGDVAAAIAYYEEAVPYLRTAEELPALSRTLAVLGMCLPALDADRTRTLTDEALHLARAVGEDFNLAFVLVSTGQALFSHSADSAEVQAVVEEALRLARSLNADFVAAVALNTLAMLAERQGQPKQARSLCHEALLLYQAAGDLTGLSRVYSELAKLAAISGDLVEAAACWRSALAISQDLGSESATAICLVGAVEVLDGRRRFESAVRLLAVSDRLRQTAERHPFIGPRFHARFEPTMNATRVALSQEAFAQAWAAGERLSVDQAVDLALAELASAAPTDAMPG